VPAFNNLFYLEFEAGHPMLAFWYSVAREHRLDTPCSLTKHDYSRLNVHSLVLLNWKVDFSQADLDALLRTEASVFAHIPSGADLLPGIVIDNVLSRMADCCTEEFSSEPSRKIGQAPSLETRLRRILSGSRQVYDKIRLKRSLRARVQTPAAVFLASPFAPKQYDPFYRGVSAAMKKLGIRILNPGDEPGTDSVGDNVREDIRKCDFVIANLSNRIRQYEWSRNANVWYEIGYARHANKPVLLCSQAGDQFRMPSDVEGAKFVTYCDSIHLALQLFYGFGGHENPRIH